MRSLTDKLFWVSKEVRFGALFLLGGFLLNYLLEHNGIGHLPDLYFPIFAFGLISTGLTLFLFGLGERSVQRSLRKSFALAIVVSFPATLIYGASYLVVQFADTGAGAFGECPGLRQAASASHDVPDSVSLPQGGPAAYCVAARYGIFLTRYLNLRIYGVTTSAAQERVLLNVSSYHKMGHTCPLRVAFYDRENWTTWHNDRNGASGGERGPEKLIRVVTLR